VINLDAVGGRGAARIELGGDRPRSPSASLVQTLADRLVQQTGAEPDRPSALQQLVELGFPFSRHEHAPFVAVGTPAVTVTTVRGSAPLSDTAADLDPERLGQVGRAVQQVVASLDQGLELPPGEGSYVWLGERIVRGWAIQLVLVAALLPFLAATVDLFARCRRKRLPLAPALRSYRSRLGFWLFAGLLFAGSVFLGAWPGGPARPPAPAVADAVDWPLATMIVVAVLAGLGWLVGRERLIPRRPVSAEDELAGATGALLVLGLLALAVAAANPYALVFLLPSLHAWLWLPQVRERSAAVRGAVVAAGLAGPVAAVVWFAVHLELGAGVLWYLPALVAVGYVDAAVVVAVLAWLAAAAQFAALASSRYAPYPDARERPPRGPIRATIRRLVLVARARRRVPTEAPDALREV
jgi:hypothetical protein